MSMGEIVRVGIHGTSGGHAAGFWCLGRKDRKTVNRENVASRLGVFIQESALPQTPAIYKAIPCRYFFTGMSDRWLSTWGFNLWYWMAIKRESSVD